MKIGSGDACRQPLASGEAAQRGLRRRAAGGSNAVPDVAAAVPLTSAAPLPIPGRVSRPDGRPARERRKAAGEESPGSMDMRCRITSGGGNPRESATETRPPAPLGAAGKGEKVR